MLDKNIVQIVEELQTKVDGVLEKLELRPGMSLESLWIFG